VTRGYRLGRRQAAVDRTHSAIVAAARALVAAGARRPSATAVARRAGVSRATVYNRFGSIASLLDRLGPDVATAPLAPAAGVGAREALHSHFRAVTSAWAIDPALYRHLPSPPEPSPEAIRGLVDRLAADDALRPGCSLKEAEDVIALLSAFPSFDRLHRDGRRPAGAVADILMRLAGATLA